MSVNVLIGYLNGYIEAQQIIGDVKFNEKTYKKIINSDIILCILDKSDSPQIYFTKEKINLEKIDIKNILFIISEHDDIGFLLSGGDNPSTLKLDKEDLNNIKKAISNIN